jgi:2-oxo-3-hexenedioate decarboxylase
MLAPTVDIAACVEELARAERDRRPIARLTDRLALDVESAYQVQTAGFERRLASGDRPLGYKLGLTSRAKQRAMGVAEPLWGRLSTGMLHSEDAALDATSLIQPRAEPEIAFLLGSELDGATASVATVLAATRALFPALEVLDSRFRDYSFALPDVIADNASAAKVVCGGRPRAPETLNPQTEGMVLRRDGEVVDTAAGAAVSGHPAEAVAWLARTAGTLPAGAIVLSGGLTAPLVLEPRTTVSAEFATLGTVTLRCSR